MESWRGLCPGNNESAGKRKSGRIPVRKHHLKTIMGEVAWAAQLYPEARSYLDVYERFGQLGMRAVFAHCIWLDDADRRRSFGESLPPGLKLI